MISKKFYKFRKYPENAKDHQLWWSYLLYTKF